MRRGGNMGRRAGPGCAAPGRAVGVEARSVWGAGTALAVLWFLGCSAPPTPSGQSPAPAQVAAASRPGAVRATGVADVDAALHAHVLAPSESLAVRLLGTIGPDGNWSLARIGVEGTATGVRIVPRVQQGNAPQVIQMVIPLDTVLWVRLPPGVQTVEVQGRDSTFVAQVQVEAGRSRPPPETRLAYKMVTNIRSAQEFITIDALPGDGFVEAIEIRETRATGVGEWRRLEGCQRAGAALMGELPVRENDDLRTIEARAVDGQGIRDPEPALLNMPSR